VKKLTQAGLEVSEIVQFEHWLRFYFIAEREDGKLFMLIPDENMASIKEKYPKLAPLAEMIQGVEMDQQASMENLCAFISSRLDGQKYAEGTIERVFDNKAFKIENYLFNLWAQSHEGLLDEEFQDFDRWRELYTAWKHSDEVQHYLQNLVLSPAADQGSSSSH
jgi:hypothetical protein